MRARGLRAGLAALATAVAVVAGCATAPAAPQPWPDPLPQRPVVELGFDLAEDLGSATGTESVVFTPDLDVCELVFRTWPNSPTTARTGSALEITAATVDGAAVSPRTQDAGAPPGTPGTLVELPLPACVPAGTELRAELGFRLTLGPDAGERLGYAPSAGIAWFGTAFPLLAWVRGRGWARDPAVDLYGESVTSEEFRLAALTVTAAGGQEVLGTGTPDGTAPASAGRVTHRFSADSVRDVAVAVGRFDVVTRDAGGVRVHVGTPRAGSRVAGGEWAAEVGRALGALGELLGPYPYADLWAVIVPPQSDGVEFPGALQFGDRSRSEIPSLVAHEVAHQWFYSLVGNNQAQHPWMDEAFATYAQAVVTGQRDRYRLADVPDRLDGELGRPMSFWAGQGRFDRYVEGVYDQGAAALLAGREQVGPERFDAAVREYLRAGAHRVVEPDDVVAAFRDVPDALDVLRRQGAFG